SPLPRALPSFPTRRSSDLSDPSTLSMLFRLKLLVLTVAAAAIGFCGWLFWFALSPIELPAPTLDFSIREGSTLRGATRQLVDAGIPVPEWKFVLLARVNGASGSVK